MTDGTPAVRTETGDQRAARVLNTIMLGLIVIAVVVLVGWSFWSHLVAAVEAYRGLTPAQREPLLGLVRDAIWALLIFWLVMDRLKKIGGWLAKRFRKSTAV
jgi:hypothetical protein